MSTYNTLDHDDWDTLSEESTASTVLGTEQALEAFTELAKRVSTVRDQTTLEAYQWAYAALAKSSHVECKQISLEGHTGTITRKNVLAGAIREEVTKLTNDLVTSLETYAQDIKGDFSDSLKMFEQSNRKLQVTDASIDNDVSKKIDINHTRIFDMFMIKDVFKGKEPLQTIRAEVVNLERLTSRVKTGIDRLTKDVRDLGKDDKLDRSGRDLPDQQSIYLMYNRKAKVDHGQFETDQRKTRTPKKSFTWGQHALIIFSSIIFTPAVGNVVQAFSDKKDSEAKVTNSLSDIHKFIRSVEGLADIVDDLESHVQGLIDLFKQVNETQESALNRRIVPIMELTMFIMKQCIDITNGTDKLFTKIVRKHS